MLLEIHTAALFVWAYQPPANSTFLSEQTSHQPPATSQQYFSLRTNQHQASATSQTNRLAILSHVPHKSYSSNKSRRKREIKICIGQHKAKTGYTII
jgi:hypothetical protein